VGFSFTAFGEKPTALPEGNERSERHSLAKRDHSVAADPFRRRERRAGRPPDSPSGWPRLASRATRGGSGRR